ncbi:MAG: hypothetical protein R3263_07780, partial [Myxococcota bacterium]|nr:hypothetical protein [Myxococcota bacterium]
GLLRDAIRRHEQAGRAAVTAGETLRGRRELRETRRARLESLREVLERGEDVGAGARHLLGLDEDARRRLGLRALVRDVLEADPAVERAVEAVLADRAEGVVLEPGRGPDAVLETLRREGGRGVVVLDRPGAEEPRGFVPLGEPLLARVRPRPGYEAVARALLGEVNLVGSLDEALRVYGEGRLPCAFVTARGDVLGTDGVVRGGGQGSEPGLLARVREVRELEAEVAALDAEVEELERGARDAEAARIASQDELENLRNRHHTAALAVANHEKDLERTRERVKALGEAQEGRVAERSTFLAESEALAEERGRLEARLTDQREERSRLQRRVDELGLRVGSAGRELSRLEAVATERRVQHENRADHLDRLRQALERARGGAEETRTFLRQREAEIATAEERRAELLRSIEEAEAALARHLEEEEAARRSSEERRDAYEELAQAVRRLEGEAREVRLHLESRRDEAQQAELALRERELSLRHLEDGVRDKWNVDLATWKPPAPAADGGPDPDAVQEALAAARAEEAGDGDPEGSAEEGLLRSEAAEDRDARREARELAELLALDPGSRRERLADVRKRIEAIGEVNLGAIEEHEELRERHRFLEEQKGDLETSVAQLRDAIARINRTSRKRFRETFEAVDERFRKNVPRLFRGGKASLGLTESEDVLEAGIEIMAQPPGKRLQSVNLLSGGEKTMTAIALLVSVFQVRPSPFFLLDEVDAALDDANVGRFNEIVRELADQSQFLLITHNKRTIEVADLLYGVTMQEKGVSTLVAVEVH